jgi:Rod binding domain-containing protein
MKVMRETVPKNDMDMNSPAINIYQGMQDSEMAQKAVKAGGIGLADQLIAYLESERYTLPREQGVPVVSNGTGGTAHEGKPVHK